MIPLLGWLPGYVPAGGESELFHTASEHVQKAGSNMWAWKKPQT